METRAREADITSIDFQNFMDTDLMPYTPSKHEKTLNAVLDQMKPGDFMLVANSTLVNVSIRAGSLCPFGHAILYVGSGSNRVGLEVPLKAATISSLMQSDGCTGAAFIRVKDISQAQRTTILESARAFFKRKKEAGSTGFDLVGMMVHGVGEFASTVVESAAEAALGDGAAADTIGRAARVATSLPASIMNETWAALDSDPNFTCAGFVTAMHWEANSILHTNALRTALATSPRDLWNAATGNSNRFDIQVEYFK